MRKHRRRAGQYTSKKDPLLKKELGINGFFKEGNWWLNLLYRDRCKPVAPSFIEFVYLLSINVARILRESHVLTVPRENSVQPVAESYQQRICLAVRNDLAASVRDQPEMSVMSNEDNSPGVQIFDADALLDTE